MTNSLHFFGSLYFSLTWKIICLTQNSSWVVSLSTLCFTKLSFCLHGFWKVQFTSYPCFSVAKVFFSLTSFKIFFVFDFSWVWIYISRCAFLGFLSCLVTSELPTSVFWYPLLIWGKISLLFYVSCLFLLLHVFPCCICYTFFNCPKALGFLFCLFTLFLSLHFSSEGSSDSSSRLPILFSHTFPL